MSDATSVGQSLPAAFMGAAAAALINADQISPQAKRTSAFYVNNTHQGLTPADAHGCPPDISRPKSKLETACCSIFRALPESRPIG